MICCIIFFGCSKKAYDKFISRNTETESSETLKEETDELPKEEPEDEYKYLDFKELKYLQKDIIAKYLGRSEVLFFRKWLRYKKITDSNEEYNWKSPKFNIYFRMDEYKKLYMNGK